MTIGALLIVGLVVVIVLLLNNKSKEATSLNITTITTVGTTTVGEINGGTETETTTLTTKAPEATTKSSTETQGETTTETNKRERLIFAQYYMLATYKYKKASRRDVPFECDIKNAVKAGLDGFALNVGGQSWELDRVDQMYTAASTFKNFKLFVNLDLTYPVNTDPNHMISVLKRNLDSEAQFRIDQRPVFGTYMGQNLTFGEKDRVVGWTKHFIEPLKLQNISVYFMPYWPLNSENFFEENFFVDAYQSFRAWPTGDRTIDYEDDFKFIKAAQKAKKKVMSSVSPCYFSHSAENNLIYRSEDTWHVRWAQLVKNEADFAQVISWNGFHESHAVGPINKYSTATNYDWYNGISNRAFTKMLPFYVQWFQSRRQPALTENVIYYYHRPYSKWTSHASSDPLPKPDNWLRANDVFVVHSFIKDQGEYDVQILFGNKSAKCTNFTIKGGTIEHSEIEFPQELTGPLVLVVSRNDAELGRTNHPTQLQKLVKSWNFNFDSSYTTFRAVETYFTENIL